MTKRKVKVEAIDKKNEIECKPWKSEQWDIEDGRISIKYPIHLTKDRLNLLYRICNTLEQPPGLYLAQVLYEKIDSDLHSPQFLG